MEMVSKILHELNVPFRVHVRFSRKGIKRGEAACLID
jgi:hypothetical protein